MKRLAAISATSIAVFLSPSFAQANTFATIVNGTFSNKFSLNVATALGESDLSKWFRFATTANAADFKPFHYSLSGGSLASVISCDINPVGSVFRTGFLDKADGHQDFFKGQTYLLTLSGETIGSGAKGFMVTSNAMIAAVPEPETYTILLAGLGVMGGIARRRMKR